MHCRRIIKSSAMNNFINLHSTRVTIFNKENDKQKTELLLLLSPSEFETTNTFFF